MNSPRRESQNEIKSLSMCLRVSMCLSMFVLFLPCNRRERKVVRLMPNVALATMMISSTLRLSNNCFIRLSVILIIDYRSVCVSPAPAPASAAAPCPGLAFASASVITNAPAPASACPCPCLCLCSCPCPSLCRCLCRREQKERVKRKRSEGKRR